MTQEYKPSDKCQELIEELGELSNPRVRKYASNLLTQLDQHYQDKQADHERVWQANIQGYESQIESLKKEIEKYMGQVEASDGLRVLEKLELLREIKKDAEHDFMNYRLILPEDYLENKIKELEGEHESNHADSGLDNNKS